jgi:hypothetical protein
MTHIRQHQRLNLGPVAALALAASVAGGLVGGASGAAIAGIAQTRDLDAAARVIKAADAAKWLAYGRAWEQEYRAQHDGARWGSTDAAKWRTYGRDWERQYRQQHPG